MTACSILESTLRRTVKTLALLACLAGSATSFNLLAGESYTFGVVPQFQQRKLFAIWKPIVDEINKRTGLELKLLTTLTVPEYEHEISQGKFDFVYANPFHIMLESTKQGYIPLVRDSTPLRGILIVRKDSPVRHLAELDGKTLAIPSPNAIGASILIRADLERLHHVTMVPMNVKSHSSVYLHVANGLVDAGGGVEKTLEEQDQGVREALRVLYTTREFPSHPIAAHPRIPKEVREKVRKALLDMAATPSGKALLEEVPIKQITTASIEDYMVMRNWGLESYWIDEKK